MSVRTEWHLAGLTPSDEDPFSETVYSTGIQINLQASEAELAEAYKRLLLREGRLAKQGVTCHWKDGGMDCLRCPHATLDAAESRARLCRLGKDQHTVERACEAAREHRVGEFEELGLVLGEFEELADAVLGPELDLLTLVGI